MQPKHLFVEARSAPYKVRLSLRRIALKTRDRKKSVNHSGSGFTDFLEEEGIREEAEAIAVKRVKTWQLQETIKDQIQPLPARLPPRSGERIYLAGNHRTRRGCTGQENRGADG